MYPIQVILQMLTRIRSFFNVEKTQIRPLTAVEIHYAQAGGVTGHIMMLCMLLMYTTAHAKIRQQSFETFWYTHHLFIPFMLGLYTHATGCFVRDTALPYSPFAGDEFWAHCIGYQGWRWELWGGALYFAERVYREIRARRETEIIRVVRHPYGKPYLFKSYPPNANLTRRHGNPIPQTLDEVQSWAMALLASSIRLPPAMASLHHHFLPI
jgi:hypothetical protein